MVYNALTIQDEVKHVQSTFLLNKAISESNIVLSTLMMQELGYVLGKKDLPGEEIEGYLETLMLNLLVGVEHRHLVRAIELSTKISFKNINDCIHTAIAESLNCEILYTYNQSDFKRIQKLTELNIVILWAEGTKKDLLHTWSRSKHYRPL